MKVKIMLMMFAGVHMLAMQSFAADAPSNSSQEKDNTHVSPAAPATAEPALVSADLRNSMGLRYAKMLTALSCPLISAGATAGFATGSAVSASGSAAQIGLAVGAGVCGCCLTFVACVGCFSCAVHSGRADRQNNAIQEPLAVARQVSQEIMGNVPAPRSSQASPRQISVAVSAHAESAPQ